MEDKTPTDPLLPPKQPGKRSLELGEPSGAQLSSEAGKKEKRAVDGKKQKRASDEAEGWRTDHEKQIRQEIDAELLHDAVLRYHLFQGHRQVGGGAQVGELYEIFRSLGIVCWRDLAQAVRDKPAMIRGVAESSVYTLYLTEDALSYYVVLEARAAMELGKPVIIFMEDDKRKSSYAGGSVEAATAGWPEDLKVYFQSATYISWGGQPYQWSIPTQNARLRDVLQVCQGKEWPVPHNGAGWSDALAAVTKRDPEYTPPAGGQSAGTETQVTGPLQGARDELPRSLDDSLADSLACGRDSRGRSRAVSRAVDQELQDRRDSQGRQIGLCSQAHARAGVRTAAKEAAQPAEFRYLIDLGTGCSDAALKPVLAHAVSKVNAVNHICTQDTPGRVSASPAEVLPGISRREQLTQARKVGKPADALDVEYAIKYRGDSPPLVCGDLVLTTRSSGEVQYGRVISDERANLPRHWLNASLQAWLVNKNLGQMRAFDGMDGQTFIEFFDKATMAELQEELDGSVGFAVAQLRVLKQQLGALLQQPPASWGWMRSVSPPQELSFDSPGRTSCVREASRPSDAALASASDAAPPTEPTAPGLSAIPLNFDADLWSSQTAHGKRAAAMERPGEAGDGGPSRRLFAQELAEPGLLGMLFPAFQAADSPIASSENSPSHLPSVTAARNVFPDMK